MPLMSLSGGRVVQVVGGVGYGGGGGGGGEGKSEAGMVLEVVQIICIGRACPFHSFLLQCPSCMSSFRFWVLVLIVAAAVAHKPRGSGIPLNACAVLWHGMALGKRPDESKSM